MITNPTLQLLSSFEKIKLPKMGDKPKSVGMMTRSRPPIQQASMMNQQPAILARDIQMHIREARKMQKNGERDGTVV
tara:strand:- start:5636 stop:5866 length:231 start_codon:yes stop_codon:yes gene_type:complete